MHDAVHVGLVLALFALPVRLGAQQAPEPPPKADRWKVSAELSYTDQSGNKVLRLLTGGLNISHLEKDRFKLESSLQSRYGKSDGEVVARNHYGSLIFDLHPNDPWSPFLYANAERDPFKRLDLRLSSGAGAKYTPYRADKGGGELSLSLALLHSYEDLRPSDREPFPDSRNRARWSLRFRGGEEIRSGINVQQTSFFQPTWGEMADYLLRSQTGMKVLLTERLALSVEYQLNRNSRPPVGVEPEDRLFKTGLIIDF